MEPDKESFFEERMRRFVERASDEVKAGVILASRSTGSFDGYPPMQRYAERVFNQLCANVTGNAGDYCYGPFLMHRTLLPHVAGDPELGLGLAAFDVCAAARLKPRIAHVVDDHPCPADQRQEDDRDRRHRMRQLSKNIMGLLA